MTNTEFGSTNPLAHHLQRYPLTPTPGANYNTANTKIFNKELLNDEIAFYGLF